MTSHRKLHRKLELWGRYHKKANEVCGGAHERLLPGMRRAWFRHDARILWWRVDRYPTTTLTLAALARRIESDSALPIPTVLVESTLSDSSRNDNPQKHKKPCQDPWQGFLCLVPLLVRSTKRHSSWLLRQLQWSVRWRAQRRDEAGT